MDAAILCAGRGTRLRPLTDTAPKPLIPILGKGSLERTLDVLPPQVDRIILVVGYLAEQIKEKIGDVHHGRPVVYVTQDPLDGTGGCLRQIKQQIPDLSDRFLVLCGDDLYASEDLAKLAAEPRAFLVFPYIVTDAKDTKDACLVNAQGYLTGFYRPSAGETVQMNIGAYCLDQHWFETQPVLVPGKADEWSLPHALPELLEKQVPMKVLQASFWMPVGTPEELKTAETFFQPV